MWARVAGALGMGGELRARDHVTVPDPARIPSINNKLSIYIVAKGVVPTNVALASR